MSSAPLLLRRIVDVLIELSETAEATLPVRRFPIKIHFIDLAERKDT